MRRVISSQYKHGEEGERGRRRGVVLLVDILEPKSIANGVGGGCLWQWIEYNRTKYNRTKRTVEI